MSNQKRTVPKGGKKRHIIQQLAAQERNRRKRMTAADKYVEEVRIQDEQKRGGRRLQGMDGYMNAAAGLGAASPLVTSGTFLPAGDFLDERTLTNAYRSNWLAKKIIDMPAEDMTRDWYTISTRVPKEKLQDLIELEARHSVKQEITNAIRWARLYGGSIALIVLREQEHMQDLPLDRNLLMQECFQGLLVMDRTRGITPSVELVTDLDDPDFGLPMYYEADLGTGEEIRHVRIHHSRVLRFTGRELPDRERIRENHWGASELEHIWDEMMRRESTNANIAQLVYQANITTLKSGEITATLAMGTDDAREGVMKALEIENAMRTSFGVQLLSDGDSLENLPYNFAGLSDIHRDFMQDMAGAAEIPATKLFGRSPDGMNATGESDLRNYYDMISSLQERVLRPALEKLLPIMAISCWGDVPDDMRIIFNSPMTTSPKEQSEMAERYMGILTAGVQSGIISPEEARNEMKALSGRTGLFTTL